MSTLMSSLSVIALSASLLIGSFQAKPQISPTRRDVNATVKEAVRLLDAQEYKTVLFEFFPPDFVKQQRALPPGEVEAWYTVFSTQSVRYLLPKLRASISIAPTVDDAKGTAIFRFQGPEGPQRLYMLKVDGYWYIDPLK